MAAVAVIVHMTHRYRWSVSLDKERIVVVWMMVAITTTSSILLNVKVYYFGSVDSMFVRKRDKRESAVPYIFNV